jgi:hypothetical protein
MEYLLPEEYEQFGLSASTPQSTVLAACALVESFCRRSSLGAAEYKERLRVGRANRVRLTYLPLEDGAITKAKARYGSAARCFSEMGRDVAEAFALPGGWVDLDVAQLDLCAETGEVTLGLQPLGLCFDEVEFTYTAGMNVISDAVKHACAMVARNALTTPALIVRGSTVDRLHMEYFSDSLLDSNVKRLLAPYVAQKVG